jgi:nucleoside-diphosphate-sugar epimerase
MKKRVAVTGGSGFIGKKIVEDLLESGYKVISLQRTLKNLDNVEIRHFDLSDINSITRKMFLDVDVVIHTAALVHNHKADESAHRTLNFEATKRLFEVCEEAGIEKFVFISTVGVYGLSCSNNTITVQTKTCPISPYAISKLDSERMLLHSESSTAISVIRLPLVYGKNAPGNYGAFERLAKIKLPLPFLNTKNKRSMVSVELVAKVIKNAVASKKKYLGLHLLAEKKTYTTKEMIIRIRVQNGFSPMLFPFPRSLMKIVLSSIGKRKVYEQLYEDLEFVSTI